MREPEPEEDLLALRAIAYVECWEQLWGLPVESEDRKYLESLSYRVRFLRADQVCAAMRHVAERFKARGHSRPTARYLAGILSLRDYSAQLAAVSRPRGPELQRISTVLNQPRVL
jgi:hypothetical protein